MTVSHEVESWDIGWAWSERMSEALDAYRRASSSASWRGPEDRSWDDSTLTLESLRWALGRNLSQLCAGPGRWLLTISEEGSDPWLCRATCSEEGWLLVEVAGNELRDGSNRLSGAQERQLVALGWEPPLPPRLASWHMSDPRSVSDGWLLGKKALAMLRSVLLVGDGDPLRISVLSSADREPGPVAAPRGFSEFRRDLRGLKSCLSWKVSDFDDYCRQLCSKDEEPPRSFAEWGGRSARHNHSMGLWRIREQGRQAWEAEQGSDPEAWPLLHVPAVLWSPHMATAACLRCSWVDRRSFEQKDLRRAASRARQHSVEEGEDPELLRQLRIRVTERSAEHDDPLEDPWA